MVKVRYTIKGRMITRELWTLASAKQFAEVMRQLYGWAEVIE